ncbi:MFS transporter [Elusimicrobiota bacterium]
MILSRNRDFFFMWLGQVMSQAALRMFQIAIMWWIIAVNAGGSGTQAGLFMVSGALPPILFANAIGRWVERFQSKYILIMCAIAACVVAAGVSALFHASQISIAGSFIAGFLMALLQAFMDPTLNKAVMEVVESHDVEDAVAFQSSTQSLANFGGAVAGAMLIDLLGIANVVMAGAASFFLAAASYYCVRFRYALEPKGKKSQEAALSGWKVLSEMPLIRKVLIGFGLVNFFATPTLVVLPLYTKHALHASATVMGILEASLWIGLLAGTFSSRWVNFTRNTLRLGALCIATMGVCFIVPGLMVDRIVYAAMLFGVGFALGVNNVKFIALFQKTVAQDRKGRFFAIMQAVISFTFPIAYFLFGALADIMTPPKVCMIQGAGVVCVAFFFFILSRSHECGSDESPAPMPLNLS